MKWVNNRQSSNVDDRRGISGALPVTGGVGTLLLALAIYFMGGDPSVVYSRLEAPMRPFHVKRHRMMPESVLWRWFWAIPKMFGSRFFSVKGSVIRSQNLFCLVDECNRLWCCRLTGRAVLLSL